MKRVPDFLTLSRGVIAVAIFSLGFVGKSALEAVILLTMIGWTTDIFDGRLARKYNKPPTWVGEQEFTFDMMMVFSALCYLTMADYVNLWLTLPYVMVAAACIAYFRSKSVTMSFAFPVVALPLIVATSAAPRAALLYGLWIVAMLLLDWPRFRGVVREFIALEQAAGVDLPEMGVGTFRCHATLWRPLKEALLQ
ncbi:MAG: CDP-alcohol phosphatidyltransferase family protein [Candidatus Bipolaricaulota bacterium]|nr:CDP-alcohol phosphatidyltransferase family protein [Candidatus Bipolaricaulota bacterium]